jgi:hypothetical protein
VAARSALRRRPARGRRPEQWEQHLALPARRSVQEYPEAVRYAAVAHPGQDPRVASAELPGEVRLMVALRPWVAVGAAKFESAAPRQAADSTSAVCLPRLAVSATRARPLAESVASVGQAGALQPEESVAQDAVAVRPRVAGHAGVAAVAAQHAAEAPRQEAEVWVGAAAPRLEAVVPGVVVVVLPPEAAAQDAVEEVARQRAARDAGGLRRVAPGVPAAPLPSAAVFHPCRLRGVRPAP